MEKRPNRLIAVVGMCGAGKSIVSDALVAAGMGYLRFGQLTLDEVQRRGLAVSEENERKVREELRHEHGMGAFATLNIPKFDALLATGDVVGDGLYSWSEYKILKARFGDRLVVVCVYASPATRYARLEKRTRPADDHAARFRPITAAQALARDTAEIEHIEKAGPIAMADYLIDNEGTLEELHRDIGRFLAWLEAKR